MSQKEKVLEVLQVLKACAFMFVTALFGILSYVFLHYETLNQFQAILCCVAVISIVLFIICILKSYIRHLNKLERL